MSFLNSVRGKIWFCLGIAFLGYFIATTISYSSNRSMAIKMATIRGQYFPLSIKGSELLNNFSKQVKFYEDAVFLGDEDAIENANMLADENVLLFDEIKKIENNESNFSKSIDDLSVQYKKFYMEAGKIYLKIAQGDEDVTLQNKSRELYAQQTKLIDGLNELSENMKNAVQTKISDQETKVNNNIVLQISLFFVVLISASILSFYISQKLIILPLQKILAMIKDLAEGEGDLTKRIDIETNDELGELANFVNIFIEKIKEIILEIASVNQTLIDSSQSLSATSKSMEKNTVSMNGQISTVANNSNEINLKANSISLSANEASENVGLVANISGEMSDLSINVAETSDKTAINVSDVIKNISELLSVIQTANQSTGLLENEAVAISSAIEEMNATLREIAINTNKASDISTDATDRASQTNKEMQDLEKAANSISKIVKTISDIADQTNLLALNATIEAASAGEAGKGFAVVANEVKELAKQTQQATDNIGKQVDEMQNATKHSVDSILVITKIIDELNIINTTIASAIEEQSVTTNEISHSLLKMSESATEVNQGSTVAMKMAESVQIDASEADNRVQKIATKTSEVASKAKEIANSSNEADKQVNGIAINTDEITVGISDTNNILDDINNMSSVTTENAEKVNEFADDLTNLADKLTNLVEKFKM